MTNEKRFVITHAIFGPVKVLEGFTPCSFTAKVNGVDISGTYDPTTLQSTLSKDIVSVVTITKCGQVITIQLELNGPQFIGGIRGTATKIS